jgi:hypothetical protein
MIKIEDIVTPSPFQWLAVIRGMRNPMNSWKKSDSGTYMDEYFDCICFTLGKEDLKLMQTLAKAGKDHRKFARMIPVYADITAPLYWWKEFDTYKVGTVANSCSTMHKIHDKEFTLDDFSHEHLDAFTLERLDDTVRALNVNRDDFIESKDKDEWWNMIQLLPSSYNQKRTVFLNYEVLYSMYQARKNHKLDEWREFCEEIKKLPYFSEIFEIEDSKT